MKIFIAALCHGAVVSIDHHISVTETVLTFKEELPELKFAFGMAATSMGSYARNAYVSKVINDPTISHVLFVNGDMAIHPQLLVRMILFGKPVVGCIVPETKFNYKQFHNSRLSIDDARVARCLATDSIGSDRNFVTTRGPDGEQLQFMDGFVRVNYASAALLLIRREALLLMKEKFPELWLAESGAHYRETGLEGGVLQCFEGFQGSDGVFVRDDHAFCRRWIDGCGGEIWSCIDEPVLRAGDEPFVGHYLLKMKQEGIIVIDDFVASDAVQSAPTRPSQQNAPAS
jgi:hypothetical protein